VKGNTTQCRPVFLLSDAFVKNYEIKRPRIFKDPDLTPVEEINHSVLAIKFSNSLTKDMIFSGLRDIFKKIGDFIYRGYEIEIPFTFGTLTSKERRVKFEFNQQRLQEVSVIGGSYLLYRSLCSLSSCSSSSSSCIILQILPDSIPPGILGVGSAPPHLIDAEEPEEGNTSRGSGYYDDRQGDELFIPDSYRAPVQKIKIPHLNLGNSNQTKGGAVSKSDTTTRIDSHDNNRLQQPPSTNNDYRSATVALDHTKSSVEQSIEDDEIPADLKALLNTLASKTKTVSKTQFRKGLTDRVLEQAYARCVEAVEKTANKDEDTTNQARDMYESWRHNLKLEREKALKNSLEVQETLDQQRKLNVQRLEDTKQFEKAAVAAFILPADAGQVRNLKPEFDSEGNVLSFRSAVAKEVKKQIERKLVDHKSAHEEKLSNEREYLNRLSMEVELHNAMKRAEDLEKQRSLLEAWERDGHVKNLRKLQPFGSKPVKDYIQRNLVNDNSYSGTFLMNSSTIGSNSLLMDTMNGTAPSAFSMANTGSSIGAKLNMSIGYDSRKGRS